MKIVNKKGQAAMEFLMTYGWAILIALIAIAALIAFGVLRIGSTQSLCGAEPPFKCEVARVTNTDLDTGDNEAHIEILLYNGRDEVVTISNIGTVVEGRVGGRDITCVLAGPVTINPERTATLTFGNYTQGGSSCVANNFVRGQSFRGNVRLNFTIGTIDIPQVSNIRLVQPVQ